MPPKLSITEGTTYVGFDGWYDLELLSDNGAFGTDYSASLWQAERRELARRGVRSSRAIWQHA